MGKKVVDIRDKQKSDIIDINIELFPAGAFKFSISAKTLGEVKLINVERVLLGIVKQIREKGKLHGQSK